MRKKALLALMLAATLLLSGCALIVKDQAVDDATVILKMGDKVITKAEVKAEVENQLDSTEYLYYAYGQPFDRTDPAAIANAQQNAVDSLKTDMALTAKAKELGLDTLTEEEEAAAKAAAQESYDGAVEYVKNYVITDETLEGEALDKAVEDVLVAEHATYDDYLAAQRKTAVDNKLRAYAVQDVTVTDDEVQKEYDVRVQKDKETYEGKAGLYASAVNNGTVVYYVPAGVRRVTQILTTFKEEDQTAISEAKQQVTDASSAVSAAQAKIDAAQQVLDTEDADEAAKTQAQADLDAANKELEEAQASLDAANKAVEDATNKAFENIDAETDEILAALDSGSDWKTLMDEKNQDPGMAKNEKGYAVSADMTSFDPAFVEAAMALEKPGDHSGKVKGTSYGYYIIRYEGDEPEGAIALDEVKDTISSSLLNTKQNEAYNSAVEKWVEEAGISVDMNALRN